LFNHLPSLRFGYCAVECAIQSLFRIEIGVCPVQDASNLLKFGMLILHCGGWTCRRSLAGLVARRGVPSIILRGHWRHRHSLHGGGQILSHSHSAKRSRSLSRRTEVSREISAGGYSADVDQVYILFFDTSSRDRGTWIKRSERPLFGSFFRRNYIPGAEGARARESSVVP